MSTEPLEALLQLVPHMGVLNHRPGSLKLGFRLGRAAAHSGTGLNSRPHSVPGILGTRVNLFNPAHRLRPGVHPIPFVGVNPLPLRASREPAPGLKNLGDVVARAAENPDPKRMSPREDG